MKKGNLNSGLYILIDTSYIAIDDLQKAADAVNQSGVKLVQFRDKVSTPQEVLRNALKVRKTLEKDVTFILNDYVEIAKDMGADGVHLGQDDTRLSKAREMMGYDALIGLSTHSISQALEAVDQPVDYIGYGPIFSTKTKPWADAIGTAGINEFKKGIQVPVFAIGGINLENLPRVLASGADGVAVVSMIWESSDWVSAIKSLLNAVGKERSLNQYEETYRGFK